MESEDTVPSFDDEDVKVSLAATSESDETGEMVPT
jgi:hypothetical protein